MNEVTIFGTNYDGALDGKEYCERCGFEVVNFQCGCCQRCDGDGWVPTTPMDEGHYSFDSRMTKPCPECGGS